MKAIIILNCASEEDIGKKTSIRLKNEENEWIEEVTIKPMPKEKEVDYSKAFDYADGYFAEGWNACLEEIEK